MEKIIIGLIIIGCLFFIGKRFVQIFKGEKGCGCEGCKCNQVKN